MCRRQDVQIHELHSKLTAKNEQQETIESRLSKESDDKETLQEKLASKEKKMKSLEESITKKEAQLVALKQAQELSGDASMVREPGKRSSLPPSTDGMFLIVDNRRYQCCIFSCYRKCNWMFRCMAYLQSH